MKERNYQEERKKDLRKTMKKYYRIERITYLRKKKQISERKKERKKEYSRREWKKVRKAVEYKYDGDTNSI